MAAAGNAGDDPVYVDDLYSTHAYAGNASTNARVNGIDLADRGGLVQIKRKDDEDNGSSANKWLWFDTVRGNTEYFNSQVAKVETVNADVDLSSFNSNGFTIKGSSHQGNTNNASYCSWSFAKHEKFFDIIQYTGTGSPHTIAHNLGSVPGMLIVTNRTGDTDAMVWHRSTDGVDQVLKLNGDDGDFKFTSAFNDAAPTSSVFTVGSGNDTNQSGGTFIAYLFAHNNDDGIFGTEGDEDIIKCDGFTANGSGNALINLGFEPQYLMLKCLTGASNDTAGHWTVIDIQRGWGGETSASGFQSRWIKWNRKEGEQVGGSHAGKMFTTATGFGVNGQGNNQRFAYMAIRRSHKPASEFTSSQLFGLAAGGNENNLSGGAASIPTGNFVDLGFMGNKSSSAGNSKWTVLSRIMAGVSLNFQDAFAGSGGLDHSFLPPTGFGTSNLTTQFGWGWRRTTGYFDQIVYKGGNSIQSHNLGATPEMIWIKCLSDDNPGDLDGQWMVGLKILNDTRLAASVDPNAFLTIDTNSALLSSSSQQPFPSSGYAFQSSPADGENPDITKKINIGNSDTVARSGEFYTAYLFASVPGIAKIGTYTGNGGSQTINCGFSNGAKWVLIKSISATGSWQIFDTTRGLVDGNDARLLLDLPNAETSADLIDPNSSGFALPNNSSTNANTVEYMFYAIAT